ncbi:MAG TPA: hypothetical protein VKX34_08720 [Aequorivita sp.]|nr:hypothetical protein [Aequorivita sp.]
MKIWSLISELEFSKLWRLAWIGVRNPLLVLPTHKATIKTMKICDKLYGSSHHAHNRANAFRHAFWNILIAKSVIVRLKSEEKTVAWAEKITSLHEELMPNHPLEKEMDLHNNEVGRLVFKELKAESIEAIIQFIKQKSEEAVQIKTVEETDKLKGVLVFIEE